MAFESGQVLAGKYRLNQLLGTGGMATVWSATNVFTEREFAIKFLLESISKSPEAARRFLMEGKISGRVQHPNVIEVMDIGQAEDGALFIVMELLSGVSLETAMRRQQPPMTIYEFMGVMQDVARALLAAHRGGVVHRDLKPSNIYLHKDRAGIAVPKVLDFGVSKFLLEEDRNQTLTLAGTVLGSPLYMSPEQAMGVSDLDHRTDIFAFGAILFEGLCGFRCFEGTSFNALIVMIATQQPKRIDDCAAYLPKELRAIVRDCLVTDRALRLQHFDVVIDRINAILPQLETLPLRLPSPIGAGPASDPDATNAMPAMVRPSDRPPSILLDDTHTKSPATGFTATPRPNATKHLPIMLFAGAGVVLASMFVVIVILFMRARQVPVVGLPVTASTSVTTTAAPMTEIDEPADLPGISIDSLPSGVPASPKAGAPKGNGKLWISAAPSWCNVTIDNTARGPTPITDIELSAGPHTVKCVSASGKTETMVITVYPSATTKQKFNVEP